MVFLLLRFAAIGCFCQSTDFFPRFAAIGCFRRSCSPLFCFHRPWKIQAKETLTHGPLSHLKILWNRLTRKGKQKVEDSGGSKFFVVLENGLSDGDCKVPEPVTKYKKNPKSVSSARQPHPNIEGTTSRPQERGSVSKVSASYTPMRYDRQ